MPGLIRHAQCGDTIIEVLFAVTVFAMVAVGAMAIMNQGTGTAQRSLEITQARQQIDAQAEAIRYVHQSYVAQFQRGATPTGAAAEWTKMMARRDAQASNFGGLDNGRCPGVPGNAFILNARKATMQTLVNTQQAPPPYSQVVYDQNSNVLQVYGLWVEAVEGNSTKGPNYIDFHIRACWDSPGSDVPVTLGTIVRLYEPR